MEGVRTSVQRMVPRSLQRRAKAWAGRLASNSRMQWVPPLPSRLRRRFASPRQPWPIEEREVVPALRSQAGTRRVEELADQAHAEAPLQDFLQVNVRAMLWVRGHMWRSSVPVAPRYWRARIRARRVNGQQPAPSRPAATGGDRALTDELKRQASALGISAIGVAAYDDRYMYEQWRGTQVGDRLVVAILEQAWAPTQTIPSSACEQTALSTYAECINLVCDLAELLQGRGYQAQVHDAAGRGMAIHFAEQAGLGQLGLNGQLLTPQAGSRCRIIMMNTDAPLVLDGPRDFGIPRICDQCQVCVRRCPPGAIPANRRVKRGVEKAQINTKRCLPVVGQAHGCAVCMKVCPVQRYGLAAVLDEFEASGQILGKGTDELEGYHWPIDGRHYGPGEKPRISSELVNPPDLPALILDHTDPRPDRPSARDVEQSRSWT